MPDSLCMSLIEKLKKEQMRQEAAMLIFLLGRLLPPMKVLSISRSNDKPYFIQHWETSCLYQMIKKMNKKDKNVQVISCIGTNKNNNISIFNESKMRKFQLDGIGGKTNELWFWASNHPEDSSMSLLFIDVCPLGTLGTEVDTFMFGLIYLLSNIIIWNVEHDEIDGMKVLEFLPKVQKQLEAVEKGWKLRKLEAETEWIEDGSGLPELTLEAPLFVCLSHKSVNDSALKQTMKSLWDNINIANINLGLSDTAKYQMGENDKLFDSLLSGYRNTQIVNSFQKLFNAYTYIRIPDKQKDRGGYDTHFEMFEHLLLRDIKGPKKFWGMDTTLNRLLHHFEICVKNFYSGIGSGIIKIRKTIDSEFEELALSEFRVTISNKDFLQGVMKDSDSNTIARINQVVGDVCEETLSKANAQYGDNIRMHIHNRLINELGEKILAEIENTSDVQIAANQFSLNRWYDVGFPPVTLMTSTPTLGLENHARTILKIFHANIYSKNPNPMFVITSLGILSNVKKTIFSQIISTGSLFCKYPSNGDPSLWVGKCKTSPDRIVAIIDFGMSSSSFPSLLPFLYLISNQFLISTDCVTHLNILDKRLNGCNTNDTLKNDNFTEWYDNNILGKDAAKPGVLCLSNREYSFPIGYNKIFRTPKCIKPMSNIPSDFISPVHSNHRSLFATLLTPQFFLNLLNHYIEIKNDPLKDITSVKQILRSLLPMPHEQQITTILSNYQRHNEKKELVEEKTLFDKHIESIKKTDESLNKLKDNKQIDEIAYPILSNIINYFVQKKHKQYLETNRRHAEEMCNQALNDLYGALKKDFESTDDAELENSFDDFVKSANVSIKDSTIPANVKTCFEKSTIWETSKKHFLSTQVALFLIHHCKISYIGFYRLPFYS